VWKLISAAGVLQEKVIPPDARLNDPGDLIILNQFAAFDQPQRQRFVCWLPAPGHGSVDMVEGIAWSCDVYFYQIGGGNPDPSVSAYLKPGGLGPENLYRYATMFSIGVDTGIELPGENIGRMPDRTWKRRNYGESWSTGDTYNATFGQGYVTVTPLQLLAASMSLSNGGVLYQPTVIREFLDSEGNVVSPFRPRIMRSLLPPAEGQIAILNMREDMLVQGKNSLVCACEPDSEYKNPEDERYDPAIAGRCNERDENGRLRLDQAFIRDYERTVRLTDGREMRYRVNVPYRYIFGGMCNPLQIEDALYRDYQPPFVDAANVAIVNEGMRAAVTIQGGTALKFQAVLSGRGDVAGKTGTAEYCDNIAAPLGLCVPGQWPDHAWFYGYARYQTPEIAAIAFVYNAGEGSANALPVVAKVIECYYNLQDQRVGLPENRKFEVEPCLLIDVPRPGEGTLPEGD
jgi:cell division protein FtsI/penicillin-binding protein 2